ncbi:unnamed protein product [[Candida] boidinii]|uniref:ER membrane protein complex subunit 1 n=1 Tax=Candida boidinii TaxID=5477 RepID=A0A9W6WIE0_CANBO|nr:hypothetical protein B5S30_g2459 [[Candida] boidinii]OWB85022.1 hypothetical protein B5S33_g3679 [[Candida] boidinii]GME73286.1 unnamed protein product [[Candida] boidinii]
MKSSFVILYLACFLTTVFGDVQKSFENYWQIDQIGKTNTLIPTSFNDNTFVTSISELGIISLINASSGEIQFRYRPETAVDPDSAFLVSVTDNILASSFNFIGKQDNEQESKLIIWEIVDSQLFIVEEIPIFNDKIIGLTSSQNKLILVTSSGKIARFNGDFKPQWHSIPNETGLKFENCKFGSSIINEPILILESSSDSSVFYYSSISSDFKIMPLQSIGCNFESITDLQSNSVICNDKIYTFRNEKYGLSKKLSGQQTVLSKDNKYYSIIDSRTVLSSSGQSDEFDHDINTIQELASDKLVIVGKNFTFYNSEILSNPIVSFENPVIQDFLNEQVEFFIPFLSNGNFIIITANKDSTIKCIDSTGLLWVRDESLSDIVDYAVSNVKEDAIGAVFEEIEREAHSNIFTAYINRVKRNFNTLINYRNQNEKEEYDLNFGFNKLLLVLTGNGKVVALDTKNQSSTTKQVSWILNTNLGNSVLNKIYSVKDHGELSRETIYLTSYNNDVYMVSSSYDSLSLLSEQEKSTVFATITNPEGDEKLVLKHFNMHYITKSNETDTQNPHSFYIMQESLDKKSLEGSIINSDSTELKTWKYEVDTSSESILKVATREYNNDEVASTGVVLGNRKVLYKYLVPNLAAVAVYNHDNRDIKIQLINMITGAIYQTIKVNDIKHEGNLEDFQLVYCENFIIGSVYGTNGDVSSSKVFVIDLFESLTPDVRQSVKDKKIISSLNEDILPDVSIQTFFIYERIVNMAVTKTRYNITSKLAIIQFENGQILGLPKFILNSRRVTEDRELNADEKNEFQMLKYDPNIIFNDQLLLAFERTRLPIPDSSSFKNFLVPISTGLESTSLICGLGVDTFCIPIRPSGSFDVMSGSFNKPVLLSTMIALVFAIFIVKPMVNNKKVKDAWQFTY